ncbi:hypothetical protein BST97_03195 [Nonlabens spongiae]|uniref:Uncharacterized protein n=1 Tax=Nonlabens spongiae TaxID=331648 RepID=A0A1W6MHK3_9FLAO|nr:hypothetical protein [Nonlabens spongiae]ARN77083.1 hypothetical protein BST97_03195 [Nonlabens spongiae]
MKTDANKSKKDLPYNPEITEEDKKMLRDDNKHIHHDGGNDTQLTDRERPVDFKGKDLDIPGRTAAQNGNGINGLNDEENKLHSQGGDRKTNLERDDAAH